LIFISITHDNECKTNEVVSLATMLVMMMA